MAKGMRESDPYYDWSVSRHRNRLDARLAAATKTACRPAAAFGVGTARFAHRALQALRKPRLQVREGSRSWTKVLPLGKPIRIDPANGLCSLRISTTGTGVCGELPSGTRHSQSGLRHQPRVVAAAAADIGTLSERDRHNPTGRFYSRADAGRAGRQHAPRLFPATTASRGATR